MVGQLGKNKRGYFQFRLGTIFFAMTVLALLIVTASQTYLWLKTVPISSAVIDFNSRVIGNLVPVSWAPLSENEIDAAVESLLLRGVDNEYAECFVSSDQVADMFKRIIRTRRVPRNASIYLYSNNAGYNISLQVITSASSSFVVVLRHVKYPQ